jgi:hypothetical protein
MCVSETIKDTEFQPGKYKEGDRVRLRRPGTFAGSFSNPRAVLVVGRIMYDRLFAPPSYALVNEDGGAAVGPFTDKDLRRARSPRVNEAQPALRGV